MTGKTMRFLLAAAACGLLIGLLATFTIARGGAAPATPGTPAATDAFVGLSGAVTTAPAETRRRAFDDPSPLRAEAGTVVTELRTPDPTGAAPWVLRSFVDHRSRPLSFFATGGLVKTRAPLCLQLGRELAGQFGWIDASNVFRPVPIGRREAAPTLCGSSRPDRRHAPTAQLTSPMTDPLDPAAVVRGHIVWGYAGRTAADIAVRVGGRTIHTKPAGPHGAYLVLVGPRHSGADARVDVTYPGRFIVRVSPFSDARRIDGTKADPAGATTPAARAAATAPAAPAPAAPTPAPQAASPYEIAARAPDPGGGPSWGLLETRSRRGDWCAFASGYIVGRFVGDIDPALGLFDETPRSRPLGSCPRTALLTRKSPLSVGFSSGTVTDVPALDPARALLRLQPGRFTLTGQARADVRLVTIQSPRDVRSVIPSGHAHSFLAVYDGDFQSGELILTAHFTDGTTAPPVHVGVGL